MFIVIGQAFFFLKIENRVPLQRHNWSGARNVSSWTRNMSSALSAERSPGCQKNRPFGGRSRCLRSPSKRASNRPSASGRSGSRPIAAPARRSEDTASAHGRHRMSSYARNKATARRTPARAHTLHRSPGTAHAQPHSAPAARSSDRPTPSRADIRSHSPARTAPRSHAETPARSARRRDRHRKTTDHDTLLSHTSS